MHTMLWWNAHYALIQKSNVFSTTFWVWLLQIQNNPWLNEIKITQAWENILGIRIVNLMVILATIAYCWIMVLCDIWDEEGKLFFWKKTFLIIKQNPPLYQNRKLNGWLWANLQNRVVLPLWADWYVAPFRCLFKTYSNIGSIADSPIMFSRC